MNNSDKARIQQTMDDTARRLGLPGYIFLYPADGDRMELIASLPMTVLTPLIAPVVQQVLSKGGLGKLFGG